MVDQSDVAPANPVPTVKRSRSGGGAHSRPKPVSHGSFWTELPILLVIAFGLAFLVKTFVVQAFYIPSGW